MKPKLILPIVGACAFPFGFACAATVVDGTTSVFLDTTTLTSVGLELTGNAGTVAAFSSDYLVGFDINSRSETGSLLSTTFEYDDAAFAPFSGSIEHSGTVTFNGGTASPITVGNFRIGFDGGRVAGDASGFFVESTTGLEAILFDIQAPNPSTISPTALVVEGTGTTDGAPLLVSGELAGVLGDAALEGAQVGRARIDAAAVPEPSSALLGGLALLGLATRRRR